MQSWNVLRIVEMNTSTLAQNHVEFSQRKWLLSFVHTKQYLPPPISKLHTFSITSIVVKTQVWSLIFGRMIWLMIHIKRAGRGRDIKSSS